MRTLLIIAGILSLSRMSSQIESDSTLYKLTKTNFAIPDIPAFNILGTTPSKILRNSKVQSFAIATEFFNGKNFIIPNSFGVEFAPYKLLNKNKQSLSQFKKSYCLNHTGISVGAYRDSNTTSKISFGLRTTIFDKSDPLMNKEFDKSEFKTLEREGDLFDKIKVAFLKSKGKNILDFESDTSLQKDFDLYYIDNAPWKSSGIERYKIRLKEFQKKYWNADRLDIAAAILSTSSDSLIGNIKFSSLSTWITYAFPLEKENAQMMLSLNYTLKDSTEPIHVMYLSQRTYVGSNQLKGFLESQITYNSLYKELGYLGNIGGEYNLLSSLWLEFSIGVQKNIQTGERGIFNSNLNLKYAIF